MAFVEDLEIYPLMLELVGCLCTEITESELPAVCRCEVMPGGTYTLDFGPNELSAGNGQAWVRLVAAGATFPGDTGENQSPILLNTRCSTPLVFELEVGISRCEPVGVTRGNKFTPPTATEQAGAVRLYTADLAAMKRAILCCFADKVGDDVEIGLGVYQSLPSEGGVGGGTWQVFLRRS